MPAVIVRFLSRAKRALRHRLASRKVRALVSDSFGRDATVSVLAATGDTAVFRLEARGRQDSILKVAWTEPAILQLEAEADALDQLAPLVPPVADAETPFVSTVIDRGSHHDDRWFTQTVLEGTPTNDLGGRDRAALVAAAAARLAPLHVATSTASTMTGEQLARTVTAPIETLQHGRPSSALLLEDIRAAIATSLAGRPMHVCRLHGDFGPTNLLWDSANETVTGIVDWSFDRAPLPPEIDLVHLALAIGSERDDREYGATIVRLLAEPHERLSKCALIGVALTIGPNSLEPSLAVALAWLHHVAFGLRKQEQLRHNEIWLQRNVDDVAAALAAHFARSTDNVAV